jgi:hypothetical protein
MPKHVLIDEDMVLFIPAFGSAIVTVKPGKIKGSGPSTHKGKKVCVEGDEKSVKVFGCMYSSPPFAQGVGTITIEKLNDDQIAKKTKSGGKKMLLKGSMFDAKFKVDVKAILATPSGPQQDPMSEYKGKGSFITQNIKYQEK